MAKRPVEITVVEMPDGCWSAFVGGEQLLQEQGSFPTAAVGVLVMSYPSRFGIKIITPEPLKCGKIEVGFVTTAKRGGGQIMDGMGQQSDSIDDVARELRRCADAWEPDARVMGNVRAADIKRLCEAVLSGKKLNPYASPQCTCYTPTRLGFCPIHEADRL